MDCPPISQLQSFHSFCIQMLWLQDIDIVITTNPVPEELNFSLILKTIPNYLVQNILVVCTILSLNILITYPFGPYLLFFPPALST